jgi:hypothetical protein
VHSCRSGLLNIYIPEHEFKLLIYYIVLNLLNIIIIMKSIALLGIYLMSFVIIYLMLSLLGLVFSDANYVDILHSQPWSAVYCMFFGWWLSIFPAREYYLVHQVYFDRVFN